MSLKDKKVLFLSASFFGYEKAIVKRLSELGAIVNFYNERPSDTILSKGMIRLNSSLFQGKIKKYYQKIADEIEGKHYDFFLLIKGESIPFDFLEKFRSKNPAAKMIYYSYDAALEYPKFTRLYSYFDRNFTFEPKDAIEYNLHFRPLFFLEEYAVKENSTNPKFDISFIGTAHTDRYLIGEKVCESSIEFDLKTFFYYYAQGKMGFILRKIFDKDLKKFDFRKLRFKKLTHSEIADVYKDSFSVLDLNKPSQFGLTMRTFEALASGKKLLTTNSDIKNYPFYSKENIQILDRKKIRLQPEFFKSSFQKLDAEILQKMSLDSWISCLFIEEQDDYWGIKSNKFQ